MYMERSEPPLPSPERDQHTEADGQIHRALGSRAVADQCPSCGHELDLPPPVEWGRSSMAGKKGVAAERAATVRRWKEQQARTVKRIGSQGFVVIVDNGEVAIGADRFDDSAVVF